MSNQWFRMYSEVLDDPKVQKLPDNLFKLWVNILCLACKHNGTLPNLEDCSFAFRMSESETKTAFQELKNRELLVTDDETFQISSWKKRQYKSDTSTERVKKHRNAQRNVPETPQIQNRTDTEQNKEKDKKEISGFEEFYEAYGNKKSRPKAEDAFEKAIQKTDLKTMLNSIRLYDAYLKEKPTLEKKHPATWLNQECWNDEYGGGFVPPDEMEVEKQKQEADDYLESLPSTDEGMLRNSLVNTLGWAAYSAWIKDLQLIEIDGAQCLKAKSKFVADHVSTAYLATIQGLTTLSIQKVIA